MNAFPYLVNRPINEQHLLQMSGRPIEEGLPEDVTPRLISQFNILQERHLALQTLVDAYEGTQRSMFTCLLAGRYYANLERALGGYRSALILTGIT